MPDPDAPATKPEAQSTEALGDNPDSLARFAPAFFGLACSRLIDRIVAEGARYVDATGVGVPVRSMSTLILLDGKARTITELSAALSISHAGAIKAVDALVEADLAKRGTDPTDKRRKPVSLTQKGKDAAKRTQAFVEVAKAAYVQVFEEIGVNAYAVIAAFDAALDRESFEQRLYAVSKT